MADSEEILDESQLRELREDLGEAFAGFLHGFLGAARALPGELASDLEGGDLPGAAARAHRLKGTASYLGALGVTDVLSRIQDAARGGDGDAVAGLLPVLEEALEAVVPRLEAFSRPD